MKLYVRFLTFFTFFFKIQKTWLFTYFWVVAHVFSNTVTPCSWGQMLLCFNARPTRSRACSEETRSSKELHWNACGQRLLMLLWLYWLGLRKCSKWHKQWPDNNVQVTVAPEQIAPSFGNSAPFVGMQAKYSTFKLLAAFRIHAPSICNGFDV